MDCKKSNKLENNPIVPMHFDMCELRDDATQYSTPRNFRAFIARLFESICMMCVKNQTATIKFTIYSLADDL